MTRLPDHHSFTQAQGLTELVGRILCDGAPTALRCNLSARECREWENSARRYLNALADGLEDEEFAEMVDEFNAEPVGYGLPAPEVIADEDYYGRESILARRHLERMPKERRAQLEREWR